jgi:prephenate dehydratase
VGEALSALRRVCADVRFLGSYPRADGEAPSIKPGTTDDDFRAAASWLARLRGGA